MAIPPPLPLEMIEHIFNQLTDPHDFNTVINSHPLWNDLMRNQKTNRLFDLVLPAMMKAATYNPTLDELLVLRQVNRNWKQAVDHQLHFHARQFFPHLQSIYPTQTSRSNALRFNSRGRTANEYLTYADSLLPGSNPFIGSYAQLHTGRSGEANEFLPLLHHYGQYLQHICFEVNSLSLEELIHILELLPNLETMSTRWALMHERLAEGLAFPPLRMLTTLDLQNCDRFYVEVLEQLLSSCGSTLRSLRCGRSVLQIRGLYQLIPNLRKLCINQFPNSLQNIQNLSLVDWLLEDLEISCALPYPRINQVYMDVVNNFAKTLITLKLSAHLDQRFDPSSLQHFLKLETLELDIDTEVLYISKVNQLKLASVCPNLKFLTMYLRKGHIAIAFDVSRMMMSEIFAGFVRKLKNFEFHSWFRSAN